MGRRTGSARQASSMRQRCVHNVQDLFIVRLLAQASKDTNKLQPERGSHALNSEAC